MEKKKKKNAFGFENIPGFSSSSRYSETEIGQTDMNNNSVCSGTMRDWNNLDESTVSAESVEQI